MPSAWTLKKKEVLSGAFFWLSAFYVVYCARPEDWITPLKNVPMAKITGIFAFLGLLTSLGKTKRNFKHLPKESRYLVGMIGILFVSGLLSPVWKGGAISHTLDFAKVYIAWVLTFLLVTTVERLRRIVFIQSVSVALISAVAIAKGHSVPRLEAVLGGIYSNPNDLAFAIVLSLPFCLAFLVTSRGMLPRLGWTLAMLIMGATLFLTASRAGFITLVISGAVCLWHLGIKGRRPQLIVAVALLGTLLLAVAGGRLKDRFFAISGEGLDTKLEASAYGSYEERRFLMFRAVEGIEQYPIFGIGMRNFITYSTKWKEVHMTYLQIGVEGGIPVLILYLMFFSRGFANLKQLRRLRDLDPAMKLLAGGLHSSLIGFVVGACFAPEAYQYFPYFAVAYTSVLLAIVKERKEAELPSTDRSSRLQFHQEVPRSNGRSNEVTFVR